MAESESKAGRVSVIMPFFNTRKEFFIEAVESVKRQTYNDWELILIDDGSIGAISKLACDFSERSSGRIIYLQHQEHRNLGISASRNLGLSIARGEYVAFLDSDDVWSDSQLEEQLIILTEQPTAVMLYGNTVYWRSWSQGSDEANADFQYGLGVDAPHLFQPPELLKLMLEGRAISPCMTSIIVRRNVFSEGCLFEAAFPRHYEDQVFIAKVLARYPVFVVNRCWGKYRQHAGSVTADRDAAEVEISWRLKYLDWLSSHLSQIGLRDTPVWKALLRETWLTQNRYTSRLCRRIRGLYRFLADRLSRAFAVPGGN